MMRWQRIKPLDADLLCTVVQNTVKGQTFSRSIIEGENAEVTREVDGIKQYGSHSPKSFYPTMSFKEIYELLKAIVMA